MAVLDTARKISLQSHFLFKKLHQFVLTTWPWGVEIYDLTFFIDDHKPGYHDRIIRRLYLAFAINQLQPGRLVFLERVQPGLAAVGHGNADNSKARIIFVLI